MSSRLNDRERYEQLDENKKLIWNLRDIGQTMRDISEGKGSQRRILIELLETGVITQRELTERLDVQPGSASEVIAKLEAAGLIVRTPSGEDRRTVDIALTESGADMAKRAKEQRNARHMLMFSCLSDEEKSQLLVLLEKVNASWDEIYRSGEKNCCKRRK